ncbi:hypothetical protein DVA67_030870 [Solirubrobacter sp. CPCC 204708]|nr:hypothetical protein [Solirubrobacter deserti]
MRDLALPDRGHPDVSPNAVAPFAGRIAEIAEGDVEAGGATAIDRTSFVADLRLRGVSPGEFSRTTHRVR